VGIISSLFPKDKRRMTELQKKYEKYPNPFDVGWTRNCWGSLCPPFHPSFVREIYLADSLVSLPDVEMNLISVV